MFLSGVPMQVILEQIMTRWFVTLSFKSVDNILRYYHSTETNLVSVNFSTKLEFWLIFYTVYI